MRAIDPADEADFIAEYLKMKGKELSALFAFFTLVKQGIRPNYIHVEDMLLLRSIRD